MRTHDVNAFIKALEEGCRQGPGCHPAEHADFRFADWRLTDDTDVGAPSAAAYKDLFADPEPGPSGLLWADGRDGGEIAVFEEPLSRLAAAGAEARARSCRTSTRILRVLTTGGSPRAARRTSDID